MPTLSKSDGTPVAKLEFTSINALLTYAAYRKKLSEEQVREQVVLHFGIADIKQLPECDYDAVVRFLTVTQEHAVLA